MSYFAAAMARPPAGWVAEEFDLAGKPDLDAVADQLREFVSPHGQGPALLFVEEDDEWLGVVRVDGDRDPRVFISDSRAVEVSGLAATLYADAAVPVQTNEDDESIRPAAEPAGDADLLADLGTPAGVLLALCAEEGQLPGDVMGTLCERAGCLDQLDELREG